MRYKDKFAHADQEAYPCTRYPERCLNCGKGDYDHSGWACPTDNRIKLLISRGQSPTAIDYMFSDRDFRYETQSMRDSLQGTSHSASMASGYKVRPLPDFNKVVGQAVEKVKDDLADRQLNDWRAWGHNVKGDCPCGIAKVQCDYHR